MNRRNRLWVGGAAALGAGVLLVGPLTAAAQDDGGDWVSDALTGLVSDGTLTQKQADAVDQALDAARPTPPPGERGDHMPGGPRGGGPRGHMGGGVGERIGLDEAATAIGVEPDELRADMRDGQTIAEVAAANDVETQTVIDAMVAAAKTRIDEAVADGRIDAEAATERLTEVTERITTFVEEGFPAKRDRPARPAREPGSADDSAPTPAPTTPTTTG